jgi:hypothetical protein
MKIAVIGTINRDTIERPDGQVKKSYGGLLYSIFTLALLSPPGTTILPVLNLGEDIEEPIRSLLSSYDSISQKGINVVEEQNNHVYLRYRSESEREEIQLGGLPAVGFDQLVPYLDADIFLVNFISGRDLSLETFSRLRASSCATIYTDIHSLTLGIDERGRRYPRTLPQWDRWVAKADVVQMNRTEARSLSGSRLDEEIDLLRFGRAVLTAGPSLLLITLDAQGSLLVSNAGDLSVERFPPHRPSRIVDTTGCGDVFLAAFVVHHAYSGDAREASRFANKAAGVKGRFMGIESIGMLAELAERVKKA